MYYFVPLSDEQLDHACELAQLRLVPYDPALHFSAVRKRQGAQSSRAITTAVVATGRARDEHRNA